MNEELHRLHSKLTQSFESVQEELEEHLLAINENTQEIQLAADHAYALEGRVARLEERINDIHILITQLTKQTKVTITLSKQEQKLFLVLFTNEGYADVPSLAQKMNCSESELKDLLFSLCDKGIILHKETINGAVFYKMDITFRERQARDQIVLIDEEIKQQYKNQLLNQFFR